MTGRFAHPNFQGIITVESTTLSTFGGSDIFITKLDPDGNLVWLRQTGSASNGHLELGREIDTDAAGNSVVTGIFRGPAMFDSINVSSGGDDEAFVAKYDTNGNTLWVRTSVGPGNNQGQGVGFDGSGNVYFSGHFEGSASFDASMLTSVGGQDVFLVKYDAMGNRIWTAQLGTPSDDADAQVAVDWFDHPHVIGRSQDPGSLGVLGGTSYGGSDMVAAKFDPDGVLQWVKSAGSALDDIGLDIAVDDPEAVYVAGRFEDVAMFDDIILTSFGGNDIFLAKLGASEIPVAVDIKPGSCPNPLNRRSRGVVPVAIAGADEVDVTQIVPETIVLDEVVLPLRHRYRDVATPFAPLLGKVDAEDCTEEGADGLLDLVLHFYSEHLVDSLNPQVERCDVIVVRLTGEFLDGTPLVGEDVMLVVR